MNSCKHLFFSLLVLLILAVFGSCGGGGGGGGDSSSGSKSVSGFCSVEYQNQYVYDVMQDTYLWYDKVPQVDPVSYDSPEALLDDVKYDALDRWSYITSEEEYYQYMEEGTYIGVGYSYRYDTNNDLRIAFVYTDSPADLAGIRRGDKILSINGLTVAQIENSDLWGTVHGEDEVGVGVVIEIEPLNGAPTTLNLQKDWVIINTVLYYDVIDINSQKVGYLVFKSFLLTAEDELEQAFEFFNQENVDELILDMRYNGGGRVSIANLLASLIAGKNAEGQTFAKFLHNDKYTNWNSSYSFSTQQNSLDLNQVFILTTGATCSASELVINALTPYIDVTLFGDTTCGKPVGMYGDDFCGKHISDIEFQVVNANDEGEYFSGISPDCNAADDLTRALGDTQEKLLKSALYYLGNNACGKVTEYYPGITLSSEDNLPGNARQKKIRLKGFRQEINSF